ncbi:cobalt-precorrin-6A reductase [Rhodobacter xanthinilyticus]|uniref:Cobalt-precorrin-6A reductase n=1 Tax=Rhodobacter xanthinilyticus TaxID=1850250 RepID=A0A1D9M8W8_9RHOB|nr:cobalt-precorrin-6A reductase [Rhodobacter xanthinilyticus]AOZ68304.1 cobalt-precorrin-6A reductase [Rhodobacter xanthinilyticus]
MTRLLLLGGTTEASRLAAEIAKTRLAAIFSYAGRTETPRAQPLPMRVGGFGGVAGLVDYITREQITHVIDATHPFAAQMSTHAIEACARTGTALLALERAPWVAGPGDIWTHVPSLAAAVAALPQAPARVFLAIGKQHVAAFDAAPQHHYLLRLVDPPEGPLGLPDAEAVIARGPFDAAGDEALLKAHRITHIVAKNAGGAGAEAKLIAARALGLPVILVDRPALGPRARAESVAEAMAWLAAHGATDRGV